MRYLQFVNAGLGLLAATLAGVLCVVALLYGFYLGSAPRLRDDLPAIGIGAAVFAVLALLSATAFFGHYRRRAWAWPAQGAVLVAIAAVILFIRQIPEL